MDRFVVVLLLSAPVLFGQRISEQGTVLAANVSVQARIEADRTAAFDAEGKSVVRVRVHHIVTPRASDRVRVSVRPVSPAAEISIPAGWTAAGISDADASEFSAQLEIRCTAASGTCFAVPLEWRFEIVAQ